MIFLLLFLFFSSWFFFLRFFFFLFLLFFLFSFCFFFRYFFFLRFLGAGFFRNRRDLRFCRGCFEEFLGNFCHNRFFRIGLCTPRDRRNGIFDFFLEEGEHASCVFLLTVLFLLCFGLLLFCVCSPLLLILENRFDPFESVLDDEYLFSNFFLNVLHLRELLVDEL